MDFHSPRYAVFVILVLAGYWLLAPHRRARYLLLFTASCYFYASWKAWYLCLLGFSAVLDYVSGIYIAASAGSRRRAWMLASLTGNLAILCWFKYSAWVAGGLIDTAAHFGVEIDPGGWVWRYAVPVGISFYTFETLSYTIDIYRGVLQPKRRPLEYGLFIVFFPHLVAGPIVRAAELLPQFDLVPRFNRERLHDGLYRFGTGLAKKVLLADVLGRYLVDPFYAAPEDYRGWVHLVALYGFSFQIYCDLSGYTDMAIGTARLFGFDLPENFNGPYRARSVREFWRRWHMTLSRWVRDYVYFPLGGSRCSELKVTRNLMLTMLIIAVWHGSTMMWVIYGLMQGGAMVLERALERRRGGKSFATTPARSLVAWIFAFHFTVVSCFFIRAPDLGHLSRVFATSGEIGTLPIQAWLALGAAALTHFLPSGWAQRFYARAVALPTPVAAVGFGVLAGCAALSLAGETPFIYFQF